jgi:hypothetical protein
MNNELPEQELAQDLSAAEIDARHARKLLERAMAQVERGELEPAIHSCRQAVHLIPDSFPAHSLLAMLLRRAGQLKEAVESSEIALTLLPDSESEKSRLSQLRASVQSGQEAPPLYAGEWESFRQEMQREIKLQALLKSPNLGPSLVLDPLVGQAVPHPSPVLPTPPVAANPSFKFVWLGGLALCVALLFGVIVWGLRSKESEIPPATSMATQMTPNVEGTPTPATVADPSSTPSVDAAVAPTPSPTQSVRAVPQDEAENPQVSPQRPMGNASRTPRRAPVAAPSRGMSRAESDTQQTEPLPAPHVPLREPEVLPLATPVVRSENNRNEKGADVGPRFSSPKSASKPDDVGPRFSSP